MNLKFTILGCGNSTGVPAIGNVWGVCDPVELKNRRTRCSLLIQSPATTLVIDTGPDFREQLTRLNIQTINAALFTHAHGDHVNGIDELRIISQRTKKLTPVYASHETMEDLRRRFYYLFDGGHDPLYKPVIQPIEINESHQLHSAGDIQFIPFEQNHGACTSTGYRFGDFAYSVDIKTLDSHAINTLQGIQTWIVDCAAYKDTSPVHANLEEIFELNEQIRAKQVYLTSLSLAMDYKTLINELPNGYAPAFDGMTIETMR
jgi:phosphoribosyl 1,2-cyclic phosphate phosphodiesterase